MEIEESEGRKCTDCVHALQEETGYSNYTVEGCNFTCKLGKHPNGTFDRFYGEELALRLAERCPDFVEGESEMHNVDCPYECACKGTCWERRERPQAADDNDDDDDDDDRKGEG